MTTPDPARFARLTGREIEFLLLYDRPLLIKEIAFRCGVGEPTVHKAFESARRKLDTRTTREAARLVAAWAAEEKTIGRFHTLGGPAEPGNVAPSEKDREGLPHSGAPAGLEQIGSAPARNWGVLAVLWGGGEALTQGQRAAAIVLLAFLIVIATGTLVMIGRGLGYTVAAIVHALR